MPARTVLQSLNKKMLMLTAFLAIASVLVATFGHLIKGNAIAILAASLSLTLISTFVTYGTAILQKISDGADDLKNASDDIGIKLSSLTADINSAVSEAQALFTDHESKRAESLQRIESTVSREIQSLKEVFSYNEDLNALNKALYVALSGNGLMSQIASALVDPQKAGQWVATANALTKDIYVYRVRHRSAALAEKFSILMRHATEDATYINTVTNPIFWSKTHLGGGDYGQQNVKACIKSQVNIRRVCLVPSRSLIEEWASTFPKGAKAKDNPLRSHLADTCQMLETLIRLEEQHEQESLAAQSSALTPGIFQNFIFEISSEDEYLKTFTNVKAENYSESHNFALWDHKGDFAALAVSYESGKLSPIESIAYFGANYKSPGIDNHIEPLEDRFMVYLKDAKNQLAKDWTDKTDPEVDSLRKLRLQEYLRDAHKHLGSLAKA